jgi:NIMA (never in mitosis gene a)-related kinase
MTAGKALLSFMLLLASDVSNCFTTTSHVKVTASRNQSPIGTPFYFNNVSVGSVVPLKTSLAAGPTEIIDPSYNLALGSLALAAAFALAGSPLKSNLSTILGGIPLALFGLFLAYQTTTIRFTFDDKNFSLVKANMESSGENVVVGGENVWAYDKIVNYDLFPSRSFPILVYFKETQTPEEFWNVGPGEKANSAEAIAKGAVPGQVHFFPAIANTEEIINGFEKHGCAKL